MLQFGNKAVSFSTLARRIAFSYPHCHCISLSGVQSRRFHSESGRPQNLWEPFELEYETKLTPGKPIIVRADGLSFSKLVPFLNLIRPFDQRLALAMADAARDLLIFLDTYGARFAYVRSDEIEILINEPKNPMFFDDVQSISSICASVCSKSFNSSLTRRLFYPSDRDLQQSSMKVFQIHKNKSDFADSDLTFPKVPPPVRAYFDCRTFTVNSTVDDIVNILSAIQRKAIGNCIYTVAYFEGLRRGLSLEVSRGNLMGKNTEKQSNYIFKEYGLDMNLFPPPFRKGFCVYKLSSKIVTEQEQQQQQQHQRQTDKKDEDDVLRFTSDKDEVWICDFNVPLFSSEANYIKSILGVK